MHLLHAFAHILDAALLLIAAALLFEELTFGGLVRLILAPLPRRAKQMEPNPEAPRGAGNKFKGENQCSR
ncbi:MAG TPA: hypothetical protein VIM62_08805 [Acidobacteriaceae bacterium]